LARGSAIVGLPLASGEVRVYFEGNVIGAVNLARYRDKAAQAASRMLHNYPAGYPTKAREDVDPREVVEIGRIEPTIGRIEITARPEDLSWWIDPADLADLGVTDRPGQHVRYKRMFDRTAALILVETGKCACEGCSGELTDAALSQGGWQFSRSCRCAWKASTINGQAYAAAIHAPVHTAPPAEPRKSSPGSTARDS